MTNEHDEGKVIDLASRIKDANTKLSPTHEQIEEMVNKETEEENSKNSRIGAEFMGSVAGGAILGYGIDWFFETLPWGLLFFLIMGFVSAVYRANAIMQSEK